MILAINKLEEYKLGMVKQFNHINNTINKADQDNDTILALKDISVRIDCIEKSIKYLKHS